MSVGVGKSSSEAFAPQWQIQSDMYNMTDRDRFNSEMAILTPFASPAGALLKEIASYVGKRRTKKNLKGMIADPMTDKQKDDAMNDIGYLQQFYDDLVARHLPPENVEYFKKKFQELVDQYQNVSNLPNYAETFVQRAHEMITGILTANPDEIETTFRKDGFEEFLTTGGYKKTQLIYNLILAFSPPNAVGHILSIFNPRQQVGEGTNAIDLWDFINRFYYSGTFAPKSGGDPVRAGKNPFNLSNLDLVEAIETIKERALRNQPVTNLSVGSSNVVKKMNESISLMNKSPVTQHVGIPEKQFLSEQKLSKKARVITATELMSPQGSMDVSSLFSSIVSEGKNEMLKIKKQFAHLGGLLIREAFMLAFQEERFCLDNLEAYVIDTQTKGGMWRVPLTLMNFKDMLEKLDVKFSTSKNSIKNWFMNHLGVTTDADLDKVEWIYIVTAYQHKGDITLYIHMVEDLTHELQHSILPLFTVVPDRNMRVLVPGREDDPIISRLYLGGTPIVIPKLQQLVNVQMYLAYNGGDPVYVDGFPEMVWDEGHKIRREVYKMWQGLIPDYANTIALHDLIKGIRRNIMMSEDVCYFPFSAPTLKMLGANANSFSIQAFDQGQIIKEVCEYFHPSSRRSRVSDDRSSTKDMYMLATKKDTRSNSVELINGPRTPYTVSILIDMMIAGTIWLFRDTLKASPIRLPLSSSSYVDAVPMESRDAMSVIRALSARHEPSWGGVINLSNHHEMVGMIIGYDMQVLRRASGFVRQRLLDKQLGNQLDALRIRVMRLGYENNSKSSGARTAFFERLTNWAGTREFGNNIMSAVMQLLPDSLRSQIDQGSFLSAGPVTPMYPGLIDPPDHPIVRGKPIGSNSGLKKYFPKNGGKFNSSGMSGSAMEISHDWVEGYNPISFEDFSGSYAEDPAKYMLTRIINFVEEYDTMFIPNEENGTGLMHFIVSIASPYVIPILTAYQIDFDENAFREKYGNALKYISSVDEESPESSKIVAYHLVIECLKGYKEFLEPYQFRTKSPDGKKKLDGKKHIENLFHSPFVFLTNISVLQTLDYLVVTKIENKNYSKSEIQTIQANLAYSLRLCLQFPKILLEDDVDELYKGVGGIYGNFHDFMEVLVTLEETSLGGFDDMRSATVPPYAINQDTSNVIQRIMGQRGVPAEFAQSNPWNGAIRYLQFYTFPLSDIKLETKYNIAMDLRDCFTSYEIMKQSDPPTERHVSSVVYDVLYFYTKHLQTLDTIKSLEGFDYKKLGFENENDFIDHLHKKYKGAFDQFKGAESSLKADFETQKVNVSSPYTDREYPNAPMLSKDEMIVFIERPRERGFRMEVLPKTSENVQRNRVYLFGLVFEKLTGVVSSITQGSTHPAFVIRKTSNPNDDLTGIELLDVLEKSVFISIHTRSEDSVLETDLIKALMQSVKHEEKNIDDGYKYTIQKTDGLTYEYQESTYNISTRGSSVQPVFSLTLEAKTFKPSTLYDDKTPEREFIMEQVIPKVASVKALEAA